MISYRFRPDQTYALSDAPPPSQSAAVASSPPSGDNGVVVFHVPDAKLPALRDDAAERASRERYLVRMAAEYACRWHIMATDGARGGGGESTEAAAGATDNDVSLRAFYGAIHAPPALRAASIRPIVDALSARIARTTTAAGDGQRAVAPSPGVGEHAASGAIVVDAGTRCALDASLHEWGSDLAQIEYLDVHKRPHVLVHYTHPCNGGSHCVPASGHAAPPPPPPPPAAAASSSSSSLEAGAASIAYDEHAEGNHQSLLRELRLRQRALPNAEVVTRKIERMRARRARELRRRHADEQHALAACVRANSNCIEHMVERARVRVEQRACRGAESSEVGSAADDDDGERSVETSYRAHHDRYMATWRDHADDDDDDDDDDEDGDYERMRNAGVWRPHGLANVYDYTESGLFLSHSTAAASLSDTRQAYELDTEYEGEEEEDDDEADTYESESSEDDSSELEHRGSESCETCSVPSTTASTTTRTSSNSTTSSTSSSGGADVAETVITATDELMPLVRQTPAELMVPVCAPSDTFAFMDHLRCDYVLQWRDDTKAALLLYRKYTAVAAGWVYSTSSTRFECVATIAAL